MLPLTKRGESLRECKGQVHCKKKLRYSWIFCDQTFQGLGLGTLFPAGESLVSDIPAGDGKSLNLYLQCMPIDIRYDRGGKNTDQNCLYIDVFPAPTSRFLKVSPVTGFLNK